MFESNKVFSQRIVKDTVYPGTHLSACNADAVVWQSLSWRVQEEYELWDWGCKMLWDQCFASWEVQRNMVLHHCIKELGLTEWSVLL